MAGSWFSEAACLCILTDTAVEVISPQAFASLPKKRSPFCGAPAYGRNRVFHPWKETDKPLGEYAPSEEALRWPHSLFPGKHGSVFTPDPSSGNPYTFQLSRCYRCILFEGAKSGNVPPHSPKRNAFFIPVHECRGFQKRSSVRSR